MIDTAVLAQWAVSPWILNADSARVLRTVLAEMPGCLPARILYLTALKKSADASFSTELKKAQIYFHGSAGSLSSLVNALAHATDAGVEEERSNRTKALLDAFLGPDDRKEPLVFTHPVAQQYNIEDLETETNGPAPENDEVMSSIDNFLKAFSPVSIRPPKPDTETARHEPADAGFGEEPAPLDEMLYTETLAKIYIRQHQYEQAREIIHSLYLKFPNKSSYFADQIRFLDKLIVLNNKKRR